jgi:hypothetical protein
MSSSMNEQQIDIAKRRALIVPFGPQVNPVPAPCDAQSTCQARQRLEGRRSWMEKLDALVIIRKQDHIVNRV